jgi:predicted permease
MAKRYRLKHHQLAAELAKKRHSQNRWADVLDVGRGHLSLLVNGKRPYPSDDTRKKLLRGLDVPFSTLFEIEDVPIPGGTRPRHLSWLQRAEPAGIAMPLESTFQEVRFAFRTLVNRPLFSGVVIVMLALGIAGNSAMFSWMDGLVLRPLRVESPERWVNLGIQTPSGFISSYSYPTYLDHVRLNQVFDEMYAARTTPVSFSAGGDNLRTNAAIVSGSYFRALGGATELGRTFNEAEDAVPGRDPVAVISYGFWQRQFAGDRDIVGREIQINSTPFTLIGVMAEGFGFARLEPTVDLWTPLVMQETVRPGSGTFNSRGRSFLTVYARTRPDLEIEQAAAQFNDMHALLVEEFPDDLAGSTVSVQPATQAYLGAGEAGAAMPVVFALLMAVIGAVLLIACINVANLLLARGADRGSEIAMRVALGASRGRIVKQLLVESLLLSGCAAVLGIVLAMQLNRLVFSFLPALPIPVTLDVGIDGRAVLFTSAVAILTGLIFGTVPALRAAGTDVVGALHGSGRVARGNRLRNGLVVLQIAMSLALLIGAGLFLRSLQNASAIDPGFRPDGVVVAALDPALQGYTEDESRAFYRALDAQVRALPGVDSTALAEMLPMSLGTQQWGAQITGYVPAENERMNLDYNYTSPGYFDMMGIAIRQGRDFNWDDTGAANGAVIINETMARRYWPDGDALGGEVRSGGMDRVVVGVVSDAKYYSLGETPLPYMYFPHEQSRQTALALHVRSSDSFDSAVDAIRREVASLDAAMPIFAISSLEAQMGVALMPATMTAGLLAAFGGFALFLAGVGLYGVMAYVVGQRSREIGIRMALGAAGGAVISMVLRSALTLLGMGAVLGLGAGVALGVAAQGTLYGVGASDPVALAFAMFVIASTVLLAAWLPARRAAAVDPVEVLRAD